MSAQISLNPMATTNALGLFNTNSNGFTQGDAQDDPAVKFSLAGGTLTTAAIIPLWGGVPIVEGISSGVLGNEVLQAEDDVPPTGVCVFNQAFAGITTPSSNVPLYSPGMSVNFYRFGSGARIPLALDPVSVTLEGELINTTVYYDYTNNWVTANIPSVGQAALPVKVLKISTQNNKTVSYSSVTGNANWATDGLIALVQI